ncbi:hypothetical protein P3L10_027574 [Capsicum annuum]
MFFLRGKDLSFNMLEEQIPDLENLDRLEVPEKQSTYWTNSRLDQK